ncbi:MAG: hypothetical protein ACHQLQ_03335 [Candidatus Acidiferrales bacterium]
MIQAKTWLPLESPGILSVPLGFLAAFVGILLGNEFSAEAKLNELMVRANTGLGAEKAADH